MIRHVNICRSILPTGFNIWKLEKNICGEETMNPLLLNSYSSMGLRYAKSGWGGGIVHTYRALELVFFNLYTLKMSV